MTLETEASMQKLKQLYDDLFEMYDKQAAIFKLPLKEMLAAQAEFDKVVQQSTSPLVNLVISVHSKMVNSKLLMEVKHAMFRAAIAIALDGPGELAKYPDPVDGKPFGYREIEGDGFELVSEKEGPGSAKLVVYGEKGK